jgi:hypothetical protein
MSPGCPRTCVLSVPLHSVQLRTVLRALSNTIGVLHSRQSHLREFSSTRRNQHGRTRSSAQHKTLKDRSSVSLSSGEWPQGRQQAIQPAESLQEMFGNSGHRPSEHSDFNIRRPSRSGNPLFLDCFMKFTKFLSSGQPLPIQPDALHCSNSDTTGSPPAAQLRGC